MTYIEDELLAKSYEYTINIEDVHEIAWRLQDLHSREFAKCLDSSTPSSI